MLRKSFLDHILQSKDKCPIPFRLMCAHLKVEAEKRFEDGGYLATVGFFFLRCVCPAILSPERNAVIEGTPTPEVRRALILLTKLIQNVAAGVEFDGSKEDFMTITNFYIRKNAPVVRAFLAALSEPPAEPIEYPVASFPISHYDALHDQLEMHSADVADWIRKLPLPPSSPSGGPKESILVPTHKLSLGESPASTPRSIVMNAHETVAANLLAYLMMKPVAVSEDGMLEDIQYGRDTAESAEVIGSRRKSTVVAPPVVTPPSE
eukprot:TRINITY_DN4663_c0_g2_i2.p1 TRINITY_DN4663_c0_g2~~TRINITY_DN4663_c0_g2_i2.p1  ORF type:complete len:264 (-),score=53.34 TRINITY_DN4663_c0_g2_i2:162-953(-)